MFKNKQPCWFLLKKDKTIKWNISSNSGGQFQYSERFDDVTHEHTVCFSFQIKSTHTQRIVFIMRDINIRIIHKVLSTNDFVVNTLSH